MSLLVDFEKKLGEFNLKVKFEVKEEIVGLLGASGCGKSMTLKCIAGVEKPDKGKIILNGRVLYDSENNICLPARKRNVGYLFQEYALFPNMTVKENIMCVIKDKKDYDKLLEGLYISELENLYVSQLSGGQKQRVAMARLLSTKPDIILLDEPCSALDSFLKWQIEKELLNVFEEFGKTVVYVSHDRNEIYRMTDKAYIMQAGEIVEGGTTKEIFSKPSTLATTLLTGCKNFTKLKYIGAGVYEALNWGTQIKCEDNPEYKIAGYRAHYFTPVTCMEATNVIKCKVMRVIEDTFSIIMVLKGVNVSTDTDWDYIRYELDKKEYDKIKGSEILFLKIVSDKLIMLKN